MSGWNRSKKAENPRILRGFQRGFADSQKKSASERSMTMRAKTKDRTANRTIINAEQRQRSGKPSKAQNRPVQGGKQQARDGQTVPACAPPTICIVQPKTEKPPRLAGGYLCLHDAAPRLRAHIPFRGKNKNQYRRRGGLCPPRRSRSCPSCIRMTRFRFRPPPLSLCTSFQNRGANRVSRELNSDAKNPIRKL